MRRLSILFVTAYLSMAQASFADATLGADLARKGSGAALPCVQCHGAQGEGQPSVGFPALAGQSKDYLLKQLQDFKAGRRSSSVMRPIVQALTEQQLDSVAEYYAGLVHAPAAPSAVPATDPTALGERLALKGNWGKEIPACFACHGKNGAGVTPHFPRLAGQNATYIEQQMSAWKSGARQNDPQGLMKAVAEKLSQQEIAAVSAYLEKLR